MKNALEGLRVLVTRPRLQSEALVRKLEELGAEAVLYPGVKIAPVEDDNRIKQILKNVNEYDWLVFTSVNGVAAVSEVMCASGITLKPTLRIAAIGPATAQCVTAAFRPPDAVPSEYVSEAIAPALGDVQGKKILLARADLARKNLADLLIAAEAEVTELAVYRIFPDASTQRLEHAPDFITVTSAASTRSVVDKLVESGHGDLLSTAGWICIGPVTESTARELGCNVVAVASEYTIEGLIEALLKRVSVCTNA